MNILVNIGVKNYDDDENNDKSEDIKNGLLDDFNNLIFFGFSENPFKAPNLSFDRRFKTVFWFRTTVYSLCFIFLSLYSKAPPLYTIGINPNIYRQIPWIYHGNYSGGNYLPT